VPSKREGDLSQIEMKIGSHADGLVGVVRKP
jgi:hypothetical protein